MKKFKALILLLFISVPIMAQWYDFIGNLQFDTGLTASPAKVEGLTFYENGGNNLAYYNDTQLVGLDDAAFHKNLFSNSLGDAELMADTSSLTSGDSAVFGDSGTLSGTLAVSTTAADLIAGTQVFKYTQAAGSLNDWIGFPVVTVPEIVNTAAVTLSYQFKYKYDGLVGDIETRVRCVDDSSILIDSSNSAEIEPTLYKVAGEVTVPKDCNEIIVGLQVVTLNSGAILLFDDIKVSDEPREIKNFTTSESVSYHSYLSKNGSNQVKFNVEEFNSGASVISVTNGDHTRYTFLKDANFSATGGQIVAGSPLVSIRWYDSSDTIKLTSYSQSTSNAGSTGISGFAQVGDYLAVTTSGTLGADSSNFMSVTATATSSGTVFASDISSEDSMVRLNTSNGYGSGNTAIRRFSNVLSNVGTAITYIDSATDGASFTINEKGVYNITHTSDIDAGNQHVGISLNSTQLSTQVDAISTNDRLSMSAYSSSVVTAGSVSWSGVLDVGDVIRAHGQPGAGVSVQASSQFTIAKDTVNVDNLIIENPNGEFETQTKFLSATTTTQGDKADLTLTLEAGFDYILTGHVTAIANDGIDNGLESWSGAGGTGTRFDSYMSNNASASNIISDRAISTLVKASEHSGFVYFYKPSTSRNVYGDSTTNFTYVTATKLPKAMGVATGAFQKVRTCYIKDVKASGVDGGTMTGSTDVTRTLNTLKGDCSFVSLSSNQFVVQAGKYLVESKAPAFDVDGHQSWLYNITDASIDERGSSARSSSGTNIAVTTSYMETTVDITVPTTFEIRHRGQTTQATNGLGGASGSGGDEVYTQVKIQQVLAR